MPTILVLPFSVSMAHVIRPLEVAKILRENGYHIIFAGGGKYMEIARQEDFEVEFLPEIDIKEAMSLIGQESRAFHPLERAEEWVKAELELLDEVRPTAVLDDLRITAGISTEIKNIPRFTTLNAHATSYAVSNILDESLPSPPSAFGFGAEEAYNQVRVRYGLTPVDHPFDLLTGDEVLLCDIPEYCPMKDDMPHNYHFVGPITWGNQLPAPDWIDNLNPERPTIYVTMGSTGHENTFQTAIEAFGGTDYQVMMTLGNIIQTSDLPPLPDNFFSSQLAPGNVLASLADVVVCHGGNGTVYQALECGTPLVTLPRVRDQFWNSKRQVELGLSITLTSYDADSMKKGVEEVLKNPSYREDAIRFQKIMEDYDGPWMAAQLINDRIQNPNAWEKDFDSYEFKGEKRAARVG